MVTQIPYLVQKSRLIERIAELLNERKLPLVADIRDESAADVRVVIEPKSRTVDPVLLMESLFKVSELESRIPLNMNVLVKGRVPKVLGLAEALREWLDHRRDVLVRRSQYRLDAIEHRLEVLGGYLIAYLNLDKVIRIIRTEDEPKPVLIQHLQADRRAGRCHPQHAAAQLAQARGDGDPARGQGLTRRAEEAEGAAQVRGRAVEDGRGRNQGRCARPSVPRPRSASAAPPSASVQDVEQELAEMLVEREPVTIVVSEKGWVRALRGHVTDLSARGVQVRRRAAILISSPRPRRNACSSPSNGKFYTIDAVEAARRPRPRRAGAAVHRSRTGCRASSRPSSIRAAANS